MGYKLDLKNPKTFNEKMQWYKLYYKNPLIPTITDKYKLKSYIAEKLGTDSYTAKLYGHWYTVDDLRRDWENLPEEFVLKANLSYNEYNLKIVTHKSELEFDALAKELKLWLNPRHTMMNTCCCRFYKNSEPCILAEEYLEQDGHKPHDYKFFCFGGKPYCLYVNKVHSVKSESGISFYDPDWNLLDVQYDDYKKVVAEKPEQFDEMLQMAEILSAGFPFVRVDFFNVSGRVYVSELTFDSGDGHRKFKPQSFDWELGERFKLPMDK
jgi:hypothetical protein